NFEKGKEFITSYIKNYYDNYKNDYENINLIVTGHSRGAAVANLYAKDATDAMNDTFSSSDNIKEEDFPIFDNVTAYTFACPNVEKVKDSKLALNMENNYTSIYNFWLIQILYRRLLQLCLSTE
ncbi:lipase family protein, partial [Eubacterium sp.]